MRQVLIRQGQAVVDEIPAPVVEEGKILVQVSHSCISAGTEMSGLDSSGQPLWRLALQQPQNVKKVAEMVAANGLSRTKSFIEGIRSTGQPTGYSAAGTIRECGPGIDDLQPGEFVACAGAQWAHHAELICVPRNLVVPIPNGVGVREASTVTLGTIALQGVRRATPTLGESFVVLGLGLLGQLTSQILKANGCHVIGVDLESARIQLALSLGMDHGLNPEEGDEIDSVSRLTGGIGADGVIITAASPSDKVVSQAFKLCRRKGRVVLVGDVGLRLKRADFYEKELDFYISTSYGPGRYDHRYEEQGQDYPVGYVRWTENRNMSEYLRLLETGKVVVEPLIDKVVPIEKASEAYTALQNTKPKPLMVLLSYPEIHDIEKPCRTVANPKARPARKGYIRIGLVGAGSFAKGMHLPNIQQLSDLFHTHAIMSRTGHNATATAKQFGARYATTDYTAMLGDAEVDAVIITTRHHLHTQLTLAALETGKHVLVEKPLALTHEELRKIQEFYESGAVDERGSPPLLLAGFNRRFSPYARRLYELVKPRSNPMILNYRMNAGYIPLDHWVHSEEGGGRNRGEACHIYDLFTYLTGSRVKTITAQTITPSTHYYSPSDNFIATMTFEDGSVANLTYTALGSQDYPKELLEVFVDGKVLILEDYKQLTIKGANLKGVRTTIPQKGQREELEAFGKAIQTGGEWPIPLWQQVQATEISFAVENQLIDGPYPTT